MTLEEIERRAQSVYLEINPQRTYYQSAHAYLLDHSPDLAKGTEFWDTLVILTIYERTPIGSTRIVARTLDQALAEYSGEHLP